MADDEQGVYPHPTIPVIFTDGIANFVNSTRVVKFYLNRFDPDAAAKAGNKDVIAAQVVMTVDAFIHSTLFLQQQMELMIKNGQITEDEVKKYRDVQADLQDAKNAGS